MNVTVAKTAGFCFGVKRAVEKVYEQIQKTDKPIYTYGPIIHNEEVVKDLKKKGVEVIGSEEELDRVRDCVVVIRSHGVGKHIYDILEKNGVEIVDATCPYVKKIHRVVAGECAEGRRVIIVGDESHPEVIGIKGWGIRTRRSLKTRRILKNWGFRRAAACAWWPRRHLLQEISRYS